MPASRCGTGANCRTTLDPRYSDYARANALDRHQRHAAQQRQCQRATCSRTQYLVKVAAMADVFRPYGMRVF